MGNDGLYSRFNSGKYARETCDHCDGDYLRDRTHTGEVLCPHCKRLVAVQVGEGTDDD